MPRGKYTNHKGRNRIFTNPEEIEEQSRKEEEEQLKKEEKREIKQRRREEKKLLKEENRVKREEKLQAGPTLGEKKTKSLQFNSENREHLARVESYKLTVKRILKPPEWLEGLESPFKWGLDIQPVKLMKWNIPVKLHDYDNQGAFYGFERLTYLLAMLFLKKIDEEDEKMFPVNNTGASKKEEEGGKIDEYDPEKCYTMSKETVKEMATSESETMYNRIGPALQHVLQTTRAHMLFFNGNHSQSKKLASQIQPVEEMSQECKAGLEGLKAKVIMSMYDDYTIVLPYLHKAMEQDPTFGYWPYLTGKVLRRIRRKFDEGSIDEELKFFEKAVSLERNPKFLVFLGQAYQETAASLLHSKGPSPSIDRLFQKAVDLYSECWRLKVYSASISRRIGNGMSKMRSKLINKTVAKEALLKSLDLSPNECSHMNLGRFYYIHEMDDDKALKHFHQTLPDYFGISEIIRLNLIKDPNYDPGDILPGIGKNTTYMALCDAAWYHLMFTKNLKLAAEFIWKILLEDDKDNRTKRALEYKSHAFCVEGRPINLIKVLVNEILLSKEDKNSKTKVEESTQKILEKSLEKYPDLSNMKPIPNLLENLKQEVDEAIAIKRRRRYESGCSIKKDLSREKEQPGSWRNNPSNSSQESNEWDSGDRSRRYDPGQRAANSGNNGRNNMRNSFSGRDEERSTGYNREDRRRNSESQSDWSDMRTADAREGSSNQGEVETRPSYNNRGRINIQYNSNSNRYDVSVTDWRSKNRRQ